jgi:hypothetical protein
MVHLYMALLDDVEERDGILSSIVNGVKWPPCRGVDLEAEQEPPNHWSHES